MLTASERSSIEDQCDVILAGKAEASNVSVRDLIFGAPRLLEWIGLNTVKRDQLLGRSPSPFCCHTLVFKR
jgi:hypothetical protein